MTLKRAESITGCTIKLLPYHGSIMGYADNSDGKVVACIAGKTEKDVLQEIVDTLYRVNSKLAMERTGQRCQICGKLGPVEVDHIKPRSKGRDDRIDNLRVVCSGPGGCGFHQRRHGG